MMPTATRYNPAGTVCRERNVWQTYTRPSNGKVVNALFGLLNQGVPIKYPMSTLPPCPPLSQGLGRLERVPIGTGELRRIHSRVSWIFFPVDKSMTVSAPHFVAQRIFSTSSSMEEATAELPIFALIFTRKVCAR